MQEVTQNKTGLRSVLNFRDIGGIAAENGSYVKEGLIFRSANPDRISDSDIKQLQSHGIRTIVDLRAPYELKKNKVKIKNIETISLPLDFESRTRELLYPYLFRKNSEEKISEISNSLYLEILDGAGLVFRQIIELLLSIESSPLLIHCQAGKDRTGIIAGLIQLLVGADKKTIIAEYLKSNDALLPYFRRRMLLRKILTFGYFPASTILYAIAVKENNIRAVLERVKNHYGGPESYLQGSGFDISSLPRLKEMLLVKY